MGRAHLLVLAVVLAVVALVVPNAAVHPTTYSLTRGPSSMHVDFDRGVIWILAVGSDARPGERLTDSRADAIQLVALDLRSGRAVGIGIPRDSWVNLPGHGFWKINAALELGDGSTDLLAGAVHDLVGVQPDYVFLTGFTGFRSMVDSVGTLEVRSPIAFFEPEFDLHVHKGRNLFDSRAALDFARSRKALNRSDLDRSANQQRLMLGILERLRAQKDVEGFMEDGTLAALAGLETDLGPTELYRLAQAITQIRPDLVQHCVVQGSFGKVNGADVVFAYRAQAHQIAADANDDAHLERACTDY